MNGAPQQELRDALTSPQYVEQPTGAAGARVWVPRTAATTTGAAASAPVPPAAAARVPVDSRPGSGPDGELVVSVGPPGREFRAPSGLQQQAPVARPADPGRQGTAPAVKDELPDGVLARISNGMAAAITLVAGMGMAEAAYNLGRGVYTLLRLPLPLAIGFPVIFEVTAATFAIQDMRDRRQGHANLAMRVATNLTLAVSAAVNGVVGYAGAGLAGLVEILPPLIIAAVIHLHGERATRAYHSQAVLRRPWKEAQLKAARRESVLDVLPLLAGDDAHGKATVALLTRHLNAGNLEPDQALIAAGWHDRHLRLAEASPAQAASMLRRLETIAATVWGEGAPPPRPATAPPAARSVASSGSTARSAPASLSGSTPGSASGSTTRSAGSSGGSRTGSTTGSRDRVAGSKRPIQELRARSIDDLIAELDAAVQIGALSAASTKTAVREYLQVHPDRARALHKHLQNSATPPTLRVLHTDGEAAGAAEGGTQ